MSWFRKIIGGGSEPSASSTDTPDAAAIRAAVESGQTTAVAALIKRGADAGGILHVAAAWGTPAIAQWLLEQGTDPNSEATNGVTPLLVAEEAGRRDIASLIARHGGHGVVPCPRCRGIVCKGCGKVLRHCHCGARLTFDNGGPRCTRCESARQEARAAEQTSEPLHGAASRGDLAEVQNLLQAGWKVNARDSDGNAPLHAAVVSGNELVVRYLLDLGADPNAEGLEGISPTLLARSLGLNDIVSLLEEYGGCD